jgi:hypothetical protein
MLRKITLLTTLFLLMVSVSSAQLWVNQGAWPVNPPTGSLYISGQNHAMAVDPDGKVWAGRYANVATTAFTNPATGKPLRTACYLTYIFNPDGTQASFSPIFQVLGDTMYNTSQRGMRVNKDGNILLVVGATAPNGPIMYLINYKTGVGMKKVMLAPATAGASSAPCVATTTGTIFVGPVTGGQYPLSMYDQNLTLIGTAIQTTTSFCRSFEVSKDGNTIYYAGYTNGKVHVYTRADEFSNFALKDSIMNGAHAESFTWRPNTNQLWISGGSANDKPDAGSKFTIGSWYAYDAVQKKVVDSLRWKFVTPATPEDSRPRALAFSPDGKIAYLGSFGNGSADLIQKVVLGGSDVKQLDELPTGYDLSQNYPNPFNPTTNIKFSIPASGFVTLKVYNTLGQEVATLLNEQKSAGTYQVDFNASTLSSGMYMYTLSSGNIRISKKMLLVK